MGRLVVTEPVEETRLDEFDMDEWRSVVILLRPDISEEQFRHDWDEFCRWKYQREMN